MANKAPGKIIIISAPSGCGKSTIIGRIMDAGDLDLHFSVSATNRPPRRGETDGVSYFFMSTDEFRRAIDAGEFVEWEEVYPGRYYGTLRREIDRITGEGHNVILDIDVKGGVNVKQMMGDRACSIFIMPPGIDELRRRLEQRATDSPEAIDQRVGKAEQEIAFAPRFDHVVVNDNLDKAVDDVHAIISRFTNQ